MLKYRKRLCNVEAKHNDDLYIHDVSHKHIKTCLRNTGGKEKQEFVKMKRQSRSEAALEYCMSSVCCVVITILMHTAFVSFIVSKRVKSIMCETIKRVSLYASDVKCTWFTSIAVQI